MRAYSRGVTLGNCLTNGTRSAHEESSHEQILQGPERRRVSPCGTGACIRVFRTDRVGADNSALQTDQSHIESSFTGSNHGCGSGELLGALAQFDEPLVGCG